MKLLAWDTSSKAGTIVAIEGDLQGQAADGLKIISEFTLNVDATHSERLLWGIHQVLQSARWSLDSVDALAVGIGPGSFTGLRIGVTTARTLSHTLKIPVFGISSLAALARPVALYYSSLLGLGMRDFQRVLTITVTDACKGELFALWGEPQEVQRSVIRGESLESNLWSDQVNLEVITPETLLMELKKVLSRSGPEQKWIMVGEGAQRYSSILKDLPQESRLDYPDVFPNQIQGRYLGLLAWESAKAGVGKNALEIFPQYLRASDAEVKLKEKLSRLGLAH